MSKTSGTGTLVTLQHSAPHPALRATPDQVRGRLFSRKEKKRYLRASNRIEKIQQLLSQRRRQRAIAFARGRRFAVVGQDGLIDAARATIVQGALALNPHSGGVFISVSLAAP
jgi:hypothetical protein